MILNLIKDSLLQLKIFFDKNKNITHIYELEAIDNWEDAKIQIDRVGFAIIDIFSNLQIDEIAKESQELCEDIMQHEGIKQFLAVGRLESTYLRNKSTAIIQKYVVPEVMKFLPEDYEMVSGVHLLKPAGEAGVLQPHQDSSLVDETQYNSYFFWMPVTEVNDHDGMLTVIPFSHQLDIPYRSLNIPWTLAPHENYLWKYMQKVKVRKGQALIFHSRLIHGSVVNKGENIRIAINSFIKPKQASMLHYYSDTSKNYSQIEAFVITPNFYYEEDIMKRPSSKYPLQFTTPNTNKNYTLEELKRIFTQKICK